MSDDLLRELGKELPWDRPDPSRRDAVRSSLLVEAAESARPIARRRWLVVGGAFATGALAAAAVAVIIVGNDRPQLDAPNLAQITASSEARIEHRVVTTKTGIDEIVHVHDGKVRLAVEDVRSGDHVRLQTKDAEVEGVGEYEVVVVGEALNTVTVRLGTAEIKATGHRTVLLSAGQTWRSAIITTDLSPTPDRVALEDRNPVADSSSPDTTARSAIVPIPDTAGRSDTTSIPPSDTKSIPRSDSTSVRRSDSTSVRPSDTSVRPSTAVRSLDGKTVHPSDRSGHPAAPPTPRIAPVGSEDFANSLSGNDKPGQVPDNSIRQSEPRDASDPLASTKRAPGVRSAIEQHFQMGWSLLRAGKASAAAAELAAAAEAAPSDPLAADARYLQAVALVRVGERAEAERVLVTFLDGAPRSLRRGRAAVLLGRLIGDRGDLASARAWLESATSDPDPRTAEAARAGLDALAAKPKSTEPSKTP